MNWCGVTVTGEVPLGDLIVGAGTLLLAFYTWRLAQSTGRSVKSAEDEIKLTTEQVEIARRAMESQSKPFIVPTDSVQHAVTIKGEFPQPVEFISFEGERCLVLRLWNVGRGPAIVHSLGMDVDGAHCLEPLDEQVLIDVRIAVSDQRRPLRVAEHPLLNRPGTLTIGYRDAAGVSYDSVCDFEIGSNGALRFLSYVQHRV